MIDPEVGIKFNDAGLYVDYTKLQSQGLEVDIAKSIQSQFLIDRTSPI